MKKNTTALDRLMDRAREASEITQSNQEEIAVPLGFATRVVALAAIGNARDSIMALIERRAWRALAMAGGIAAVAVVVNLQPVTEAIEDDLMTAHDPVATLFDLS